MNRDQLRCISNMFAHALVSSVDAVPPEFCDLFKHVKKEAETKFTGKVAYYQPIGGLFFLRFINAAVVSPSFFGLVQGTSPCAVEQELDMLLMKMTASPRTRTHTLQVRSDSGHRGA
jgi:hypothetical protein